MITLNSGDFGWDYLLTNEGGRTILIQTDYDYPGVARTFGWTGEDSDLGGAQAYLDEHIGDEVEDPGYFSD